MVETLRYNALFSLIKKGKTENSRPRGVRFGRIHRFSVTFYRLLSKIPVIFG
jgi:hypothetical protein